MDTASKIQHLYWRAGFGRSPEEWQNQANYSLKQAVDQLFDEADRLKLLPEQEKYGLKWGDEEMTVMEKKTKAKAARRLTVDLNKDWMERMASPEHSCLLEKMTLFWHGHFACISKMPHTAQQQLLAIRQHALGNFKDLILAMARDVSMIRFLNNQQNRKRKPNENFARELMELFTIGRGHYSENDIKEAARAFTGWSSTVKGTFIFKKRHHDFGSKTFMGKTGDFDGDDIIDIILERRETADFIARKIYRYFINEKIDEERLNQIAQRFYDSNYDIGGLMRYIFESDWFYADENFGAKIKSPVELVAGMMRLLNIRFKKAKGLMFLQKALGQILFLPPNVAGWAGGKSWIDNSTLMLRLNLANYLFLTTDFKFKIKEEFEAQKRNKSIRKMGVTIDAQPFVNLYQNQSEQAIFDQMQSFLLQAKQPLDPKLFSSFVDRKTKENYIKTLMVRMMSVPEYQIC